MTESQIQGQGENGEPCNCEHASHFPLSDVPEFDYIPRTGHAYLGVPAGERTRAYVGAVCDACADVCLPRSEYAIRITWNAHPSEHAHFITAGNTYPPAVARYTFDGAWHAVDSMSQRPDNAHLTFAVVRHPEAFPA